ncbi:hypothetical protein D3C80_878780 [compost metagenome]
MLIFRLGHEHWVKRDAGAGVKVFRQPLGQRFVMQMVNFNIIQIDLNAGLDLIATVHKKQRAVLQHQRQPSGAIKAGEPGELFIG